MLYEYGQGVGTDYVSAAKYYRQAINAGHATAQENLDRIFNSKQISVDELNNVGVMYAKGIEVTQDFQRAIVWFTKAKEKGSGVACKNLGALGIHPAMQTDELKINLLIALGCLQDFGGLLLAFRRAYHLCGKGGDYLMYVGLGHKTYSLLAAYAQLVQRTQVCFVSIQTICAKLHEKFLDKYEELEWQSHYHKYNIRLKKVNGELTGCQNCMVEILKGMQTALSPGYVEQLNQDIQDFSKLIDKIETRATQSSRKNLQQQAKKKTIASSSQAALSQKTMAPLIPEQGKDDKLETALVPKTNSDSPPRPSYDCRGFASFT